MKLPIWPRAEVRESTPGSELARKDGCSRAEPDSVAFETSVEKFVMMIGAVFE